MKTFKDQVTVTVKDSTYNMTIYDKLNDKLTKYVDDAAAIVAKYQTADVEIDETTDFLKIATLIQKSYLDDYYCRIETILSSFCKVIANFCYYKQTRKIFSFNIDFNFLENHYSYFTDAFVRADILVNKKINDEQHHASVY